MQRLTGVDASFLYLETPTSHMHVAMTGIYDTSTMPHGYSFEAFRDHIGSRLHRLPPFTRRLVEVPFQLHHPVWVEDPNFDLDYHVRRVGVPASGGGLTSIRSTLPSSTSMFCALFGGSFADPPSPTPM